MKHLRYFSTNAMDDLGRRIDKNIQWYRKPVADPPVPVGIEKPIGRSRRELGDLGSALRMDLPEPDWSDETNALAVYRALPDLRPQEAADGRLWTYLCHHECAEYVVWRWPFPPVAGSPKDRIAAHAQHARNHFFAGDARSLIRSNALSRLWWLGYIATKAAPDEPELFLHIITGPKRTDLRSEIVERPSMSMNIHVLQGIYQVLRAEWDAHGGTDTGKLFQRSVYRAWLRGINRRGGVVLLDALTESALCDLLNEEADRAKG